jgi:tetratricopeptide (TPR) repeat protein
LEFQEFRLRVFATILVLAIAFASQWYFKANYSIDYFPNHHGNAFVTRAVKFIPYRIRTMISGLCWNYADEYMHEGPSKRMPQTYVPGSYAGNTEIVSFLNAIVLLTPDQLAPYTVLSRNLSRYLDRYKDGLRILQHGILMNSDKEWVFELYAAIVFQVVFDSKRGDYMNKRVRNEIGLKYVEKAIEKYPKKYEPSDPAMSLKNLQILKARLLVENDRTAEALKFWKRSNLGFNKANGMIAEFLRRFESGEKGLVSSHFFKAFTDKDFSKQAPNVDKEAHSHHEKEMPQSIGHPFNSAAKSVKALIALLILLFIYKKVMAPSTTVEVKVEKPESKA